MGLSGGSLIELCSRKAPLYLVRLKYQNLTEDATRLGLRRVFDEPGCVLAHHDPSCPERIMYQLFLFFFWWFFLGGVFLAPKFPHVILLVYLPTYENHKTAVHKFRSKGELTKPAPKTSRKTSAGSQGTISPCPPKSLLEFPR